jgi:DNA polymerase-3 subunit gamma/tau
MNYQVLARKYRPRYFDQVVGQTATLKALKNTLDYQQLHHAYLFTGTRGVGKTSLARLFAKCLNCKSAISSKPCETCESCLAIYENRFVDLIEIDAASRTRVEDMHALLENIQYKPTMGRYKVYLIDEVHMLSTHSFNALLKTLEEPPEHIIFILATTDPNKLPNTILSRCLQFHLKNLSTKEIINQLIYVLDQEKIVYEQHALEQIAQVAEGSLRDALSLLEQVIMHGDIKQVTVNDIEAILGRISEQDELALIEAIHHRKTDQIQHLIEKFNECNIDYEHVLVSLLNRLHQIALKQVLGASTKDTLNPLDTLAEKIAPEQIQLYYQIGLIGRRDLALAPSIKLGFEMTLLRMLAFQSPTHASRGSTENEPNFKAKQSTPSLLDEKNLKSTKADKNSVKAFKTTVTTPVKDQTETAVQEKNQENAILDWASLVQQLPLQGFLKSLALHCQLVRYESDELQVQLHPSQAVLYNEQREKTLQAILTKYLNKNIIFTITIGSEELITPAYLEAEKLKNKKKATQDAILQDQDVQAIIKQFDGAIVPNSVQLKTGDLNE